MPHAPPKHIKRKAPPPAAGTDGWAFLTRGAFALTLILVITRVTIQEMLRGEALPTPGGLAAPAVPGPATALLLDWLCCLPALLILARSVVDPGLVVRRAWSYVPMFALAAWTLASVFWADDKFAAIVQASHWATALVLLWSTSQLVRDWLRVRVVAAAGFGLLLVLLTQGYYYRFVDLPDLQREWRQEQSQWLRQRNITPDSIEATQLAKNIESGEVSGFNLSRNTYAALLVLLLMVCAGIVRQRLGDSDPPAWTLPILVAVAFALLMLYRYVESKTAFATPVIGAVLCGVVWSKREWIAARARKVYWGVVGAFVLAAAAVVGHGLKHGTLFHISLTFRWQYWVGAARLYVHHPWIGVGWANFGPHYLAYRLPQAPEEPSDPHNFLIRAFVELGIIGAGLMIAWMLRLWWELGGVTAPASAAPVTTESRRNMPGVLFLAAVAVSAIALSAVVSIDWAQQGSWIFLECFKRGMFLVVLLLGMAAVGVRSPKGRELDDRPARWLLSATLVGLAIFLVHNLIDFSLFETGPMFLFALLAGASLGARSLGDAPGVPGVNRNRAFATLVIAGVAWVVAAGAGVWTVVSAEGYAADADAQLRQSRPEAARESLVRASRLLPINGDYAFKAEQISLMSHGNPVAMRGLIDSAIAADPSSIRYRLARAVLEISTGDAAAGRADYAQALTLDPTNRDLRYDYAGLLESAGLRSEARQQYQRTLELNDKLAAGEIRRLSPEKVAHARERVAALAGH